MSIALGRGVNISHWLSQSDARGEQRRTWFTADDVRRIAAWGFDHIRLPVDEEQLWDEQGRREQEAFDLLAAGLDWAEAAGLRVVVDLHILRSHHFNQPTQPRLYTDAKELSRFCDLWRDLAAFLAERREDHVAFELLNEPVARDPADWNRVAAAALAAVRQVQPTRPAVLGSNRFQSCDTFADLVVPDDPNLILSCHYYDPVLITHHQASWSPVGVYDGQVAYPGKIVSDAAMAAIGDPAVRSAVERSNDVWDRRRTWVQLKKPMAVAKRTGLPLYCGEFGCIHRLPQALRIAWYTDVVAVFHELGIGYANWDYRGEFGLLTDHGQDTAILSILLGR